MKKSTTPFAATVQTPVFPKTLHQLRPPTKSGTNPKPAKRDKFFYI